MDVLGIVILKDIPFLTATEPKRAVLRSPFSYSRLRSEEGHSKGYYALFTNWDKYSEFLETALPPCPAVLSIPALLDDAVAFFKSALNMAHTATTMLEVCTAPTTCLTN
jgi:hypothetical protein